MVPKNNKKANVNIALVNYLKGYTGKKNNESNQSLTSTSQIKNVKDLSYDLYLKTLDRKPSNSI